MANWEFHFRNFDNAETWWGVYHAGCGEVPWHDGRPGCYKETVNYCPTGGDPHGVYVPSDWVVNFNAWFKLIVDGLKEVANIAIYIASEGEDVDALEDIIKGAFDVDKDVVSAAISDHKLNSEDLQNLLQENFKKACSDVRLTEQQVISMAQGMGFPESGWGFITDTLYQSKIRDDNDMNGDSGWTVFCQSPYSSGTDNMYIANHAFIYNGKLHYAWDRQMFDIELASENIVPPDATGVYDVSAHRKKYENLQLWLPLGGVGK